MRRLHRCETPIVRCSDLRSDDIYTDELACKGNTNSASRFGNTFSELTGMRSDDIYILTSLPEREYQFHIKIWGIFLEICSNVIVRRHRTYSDVRSHAIMTSLLGKHQDLGN